MILMDPSVIKRWFKREKINYNLAVETTTETHYKTEDDEFTINGYKETICKRYMCYASYLLTVGLSFMAFHWKPNWWMYCSKNRSGIGQQHLS